MTRAALAGLLVLGACTQSDSWLDFGAVTAGLDGQTPELIVPWGGEAATLRLEIESPSRRCFQVDELTDDLGHLYVGRAESGPSCVECEQRTSVGMAKASFQLPSRGGPFTPHGALHLRLGVRDCETLTRITLTSPERLRVRARTSPKAPQRGAIALSLIVTPASALAGSSDAHVTSLLEALNVELSSAQLTAMFVQVLAVAPGAQTDATFSRSDSTQLEPWLASSRLAGGVPVVLAGCLLASDPVLRTTSEVIAYTPHIPGGSGLADGIFIQGSLCGTPGPVRLDWSNAALARVMAHELGHYLGLYHSVEADGTTDQLDDTGASNVMYFRPSQSTSTGFSATQAELIRAHPAVSPQ